MIVVQDTTYRHTARAVISFSCRPQSAALALLNTVDHLATKQLASDLPPLVKVKWYI